VVLVAGLLLAGCTVRSGTPQSESTWRTKVDQALGAAVSSLGTTELVLEHQADGGLTKNYVVVAVRDALRTLGTEASGFESAQPPPGLEKANEQAVRALGRATTVLNAASTAASSGDRGERRRALQEVRKTYQDLQDLSDRLSGSGR